MSYYVAKFVFLIGLINLNVPDLLATTISPQAELETTSNSISVGSIGSVIYPDYNEECPANLTFASCVEKLSCDDLNSPYNGCISGCACPSGYILESSNSTNCVRMEECENFPSCGPFEVYEQYGIQKICPEKINFFSQYHLQGCNCKAGYTRQDSQSICKTDTCPVCGPNEYFDKNGPLIQYTCTNMLEYTRDYSQNKEGCFCTYEYIYDEAIKKCVKPEECSTPPQCSQDHKVYKENGNVTICSSSGLRDYPFLYPACVCESGFVTDGNTNECISASDCACDENQELTSSSCFDTCSTRLNDRCEDSIKRCECKQGYIYETINSTTCIKTEDCPNPPACLGPNEEISYSGGIYCPIGRFPDIEPYLYTACHCISGYVLNYDEYLGESQCIPRSQCPEVQCPPNATLRESSLPHRTCWDTNNAENIVSNYTWYDCFCEEGYVRGYNEGCVLEEDCLVCGENEQIRYWDICADTCDTFNPSECVSHLSIDGAGCECKERYVYESASSKNCVPIVSCPKPIDCGPNKVYKMNSTEEPCESRNRRDFGITEDVYEKLTLPGCHCIDGYIYNGYTSLECILEESCPDCGENEYFSIYSSNCMQTCDDLHISAVGECRFPAEANTCQCAFGFVRKSYSDMECVDINSCAAVCTENEEFLQDRIGEDCFRYLFNISLIFSDSQTGCHCKKGYLRDVKSQECVPVDKCDGCNEFEEFSLTKNEDTCENWAILKNTYVDATLTHPPVFDNSSLWNCNCKKGYARNSESKCVPTSDCPSPPRCGSNQTFQQVGQDKYCEGLDATNQDTGPRCYCNSGYARDHKNECIPEAGCPKCKQNDPNSVFSPCVHCYDYCNGTRLCSWSCLGDCDCKPGFVYNENGTCIPSSGCNLTMDQPVNYPPAISASGSAINLGVSDIPSINDIISNQETTTFQCEME